MPSAAARPGPPELLTFVIADIRGYTAYTQAHGDEAAAHLAAVFAEIVREGVEARGGRVIELRGDEALAVFSSARQAVRASVDVQEALVDEVERHPRLPLRVGIGLDAGEAVPVEDGYRGGALNLAARLCSQAGPGEILASEGVAHLVRAIDGITLADHGALELKGMSEPVPVRRVAWEGGSNAPARLERALTAPVTDPPTTVIPRALTEHPGVFVGREEQARRLRWAWRSARRGTAASIRIVGAQGMGKTRLAADVAALAAHDGAPVVYVDATSPGGGLADTLGPALVILDEADADVVQAAVSSRGDGPTLVVHTVVADGHMPGDGEPIVLEPLGADDVEAILAFHAARETPDLPVAAVLAASDGVPARVHELAIEWVRGEAARRLAEAAARAAAGRSDLRAAEADVAASVIDLELARERTQLFGADAATIHGTREPPYKGLASFGEGDVGVFFGRERLVAEMVGRLAGATFLGVVGPSGSGKSSALRAGLLPALAAGSLPGSEVWIRATMRPGAYPLRSLDRAVWAGMPDDLRSRLEGSELPLRAVRDQLGEHERIVLTVDQFEELFTQTGDEAERDAFVRALVEAAADPRGNVIVVVAIRADFYGRCASWPSFAAVLGASHVLVGPMSAEEYRRAIEEPARRAGLAVEASLTDALVRDARDQPGALPLLSTALLELWTKRDGRSLTLAAFHETGGLRGAVGRLADDTFDRLDEDEQQMARAVMLRLAGPGEGEAIVRRRISLVELDADRNERVRAVVDAFTDARLFTVGEGTVEVAHEALLREWPRLVEWLDEDRAGVRLRGHVSSAAAEWEAAGRDPGELYRGARLVSAMDWTADHAIELNDLEREFLAESRDMSEREAARQRRANRRLRGLLAGVAVFLVLALVAGTVAVVQGGKATTAATEATAARLGAQAVLEDDLDTSLLLAAQARAIDDSVDTRSALLASILNAPGAIAVLPPTAGRTNEVIGSPNGSVFITVSNTGAIGIYDTEHLALERTVDAPALGLPALSRDGSVALGKNAGNIGPTYGWIDMTDGTFTEVPLQDDNETAGQVAFDPDGRSFVAIEFSGGRTEIVRRSFPGMEKIDAAPFAHEGFDFWAERAPEGGRIFVDSEDGLVVIDAGTLLEVKVLEEAHFPFSPSPDGRVIGFGDADGAVSFIDVDTGVVTEADGRHDAAVNRASFSPDGETFVTTGDDREVIIWDATEGTIREVLAGHSGRVFGTAFDADGGTAFTGGLDGLVVAWDLTTERRIGRRATFADAQTLCCLDRYPVRTVASPDGLLVASSDIEGHVTVSDVATGTRVWRADPWSEERVDELRELEPFYPEYVEGYVSGLAFSPDGSSLAVSGGNMEAVVFDVVTGDVQRSIVATESGWVNEVTFTPEGLLVTAGDDGRVVVWSATGEPAEEYRVLPATTSRDDYPGYVMTSRPSPDGSVIATMAVDFAEGGRVLAFDRSTGGVRWETEADPYGASMGWSADSQRLGLGGYRSGLLEIRDAGTGEMVGVPLEASAGFVLTVGFSAPLAMWVTSGTDGTVRLFDSATSKQVGSHILADDNLWTTATLVNGGDAMVVASEAGHVWWWDLQPDRWTEQACRVAGRSLTEDEWQQALGDLPYDPLC